MCLFEFLFRCGVNPCGTVRRSARNVPKDLDETRKQVKGMERGSYITDVSTTHGIVFATHKSKTVCQTASAFHDDDAEDDMPATPAGGGPRQLCRVSAQIADYNKGGYW